MNRYEKTGVCLIGTDVVVNVIAPHFGEEPCVQGHNGSGSVFFSMCNLRCSFCQNHDIAHQKKGFSLTPEQLGEWFVKLQEVGSTHNINLTTPEHVVPQVALAIMHARDLGLTLPIIYNTSSYDSLASIELLDGLVDIYLPDFKVWEPSTSKRLLKAPDYAAAARESIKAMHAQVGDLCFTGDGIAKKGLLVRHLVMPGLEEESRQIMEFLAKEVSTDCFVNIMEQYHPDAHVGKPRRKTSGGKDKEAEVVDGGHEDVRYSDINRAVTNDEILSVRKAAEAAGLWRFCDPPGNTYVSIGPLPYSLPLSSIHRQATTASTYEKITGERTLITHILTVTQPELFFERSAKMKRLLWSSCSFLAFQPVMSWAGFPQDGSNTTVWYRRFS